MPTRRHRQTPVSTHREQPTIYELFNCASLVRIDWRFIELEALLYLVVTLDDAKIVIYFEIDKSVIIIMRFNYTFLLEGGLDGLVDGPDEGAEAELGLGLVCGFQLLEDGRDALVLGDAYDGACH